MRVAREGLQEGARLVSRRLTPLVARDCVRQWGSVPVCVDGTAIEVEGRLFEHAKRRYHGERQSWLHSVFVGPAWVSARLHAGGTDVQGDWREQLDRGVAPLLAAQQPVGLRAASAYSYGALGSYCRQRGWDDAVSVTDPRQKAPLLRQVAAMVLRKEEWEPRHPPRFSATQDLHGPTRPREAGSTRSPGRQGPAPPVPVQAGRGPRGHGSQHTRCTWGSGATGTGSSGGWCRSTR